MTLEKRVPRIFLPLLLLLLLPAAGCDSFDKNGTARNRFGTGAAAGPSIDISGGTGTVGTGGNGDSSNGFWIDSYGPLGVKVYRTGTADASFARDNTAATPDFGAEPLTVNADLVIPVYDANPPDNNVYYFLRGDSTLWHKIDDATINAVTGIRVAAGATLTLGLNCDLNYTALLDSASLALASDIEILGTLRSAAFDNASTQDSDFPKDRGGLEVATSGGVFVRATGTVTTAGGDATAGRAGHGGHVRIAASAAGGTNGGVLVNEGRIDASGGSTTDPNAEGGGSAAHGASGNGLYLYADVRFVSSGTIRADAGSGGTGGQAGGWSGTSCYITGGGTVENTGAVSLAGGTGRNGDGGRGAYLYIDASGAYVRNSGAISTRGGDGSLGGGMGGDVRITVFPFGEVVNSGNVDASGGDSTGTDDAAATSGGTAGSIMFYSYGSRFLSSGNLEADGGDVANRNAASSGGSGGYLDLESYMDASGGGTPAGEMEISGTIHARGGTGPNGGYGGSIYMYYDDSSGTGGVVLRGYSSVAGNGGSGIAGGGSGGGIWFYDYYSGSPADTAGVATGADISAHGGNASGTGGNGGSVELSTWSGPASQYRGIDVKGGPGATPGGAGTIMVDGSAVIL